MTMPMHVRPPTGHKNQRAAPQFAHINTPSLYTKER